MPLKTSHPGEDSGEVQLQVGGSVTYSGGSFQFSHTGNRAGSVSYNNSVRVHLPLYASIGSSGLLLGSVTFHDTDFYDGALDPGFSADLSGISEILSGAAYLALDQLGILIDGLKGDLVRTYDADGEMVSEGEPALNQTIPGTDTTLANLLGQPAGPGWAAGRREVHSPLPPPAAQRKRFHPRLRHRVGQRGWR